MSEPGGTTFLWKIEDFEKNPFLLGNDLKSPVFSVDALKTTRFSLTLYTGEPEGNENGNCMPLLVMRHNDDGKEGICVELIIGLVNSSNELIVFWKDEYTFDKKSSFRVERFCERNLLPNSQYLPENKLTVFCRLLLKMPDYIYRGIDTLLVDYSKLLLSENHSDMTILSNGQKFNVHRVILENRCPTLMAQMEWMEGNVYSLPGNFCRVVMGDLLSHVYNGKLVNEMSETVSVAVHAYGLSELKRALFPRSIVITASTKAIWFDFNFEMDIFKIIYGSETEKRYIVLSNDVPIWSWAHISVVKEQDGGNGSYKMKYQMLHKKEVTFVQCEVYHYFADEKISLMKREHLFTEVVDMWETALNPLTERLHFEVKTWINDGKCTGVKLPENRDIVIEESDIIRKDLRNMYANKKFTDLTLCIGDELLPVHKAILCARSPVFSKMFEHDTLEKRTDRIKIEDVDVETMKYLLKYIYCGDLEVSWSVTQANKLYTIANEYQILDLLEECSGYLISNISVENVDEIMALADMHQDEKLKKFAHDFVACHLMEITDSELQSPVGYNKPTV